MPQTSNVSLQVTLPLSDERFASLLRHRRGDESVADLILRLLDTVTRTETSQNNTASAHSMGVKTKYYDFPEGFEIFRTSRGVRYSAKASNGMWVTPTGERYSSLNELSGSITGTSENAWVSWSFIDSDGRAKRIDALRDKHVVATRNRTPASNDEGTEATTWRDDVYAALKGIGEPATLYEIYQHTRRIREKRGVVLPTNASAIIRKVLEENSSDSTSYKGRYDLFKSVKGIGSGIWELRHAGN